MIAPQVKKEKLERLKIEWKLHFPSLVYPQFTWVLQKEKKNTAQICYVNGYAKGQVEIERQHRQRDVMTEFENQAQTQQQQ